MRPVDADMLSTGDVEVGAKMKSSKSPRVGIPHRSRSSRSTDHHDAQAQTQSHATPPQPPVARRSSLQDASQDERHTSSATARSHTPLSSLAAAPTGDSTESLENMRRRMSEALAQKQAQLPASSEGQATVRQSSVRVEPSTTDAKPQTASDESLTSRTISTDSAKTIRGGFDATPGALRTPSYPFPRMHLKLHRGTSHRSAPSHKPFTLLSPTNTPLQEGGTPLDPPGAATSDPSTEPQAYQETSVAGDPNYPSPDLYNMILMLSSEPGLEAWWANVTRILTEGYGVERSCLAVPGDLTDFENVPWGQRASFNVNGTESLESSNRDSVLASVSDVSISSRQLEPMEQSVEMSGAPARPILQSRHSIAGVLPDNANRSSSHQRPQGPVRAYSNVSVHQEDRQDLTLGPRTPRSVHIPYPSNVSESPKTRPEDGSSASMSSTMRCVVYKSLQPLEAEPDSLLVRTAVASLFGKRKPVVLTRAYNSDTTHLDTRQKYAPGRSSHGLTPSQIGDEESPSTREGRSISRISRAFEEYEQPVPLPWSQSPLPSPAARPDPSDSPFFNASASIDETAFEQNPPEHDYGTTANQSLNAVGADGMQTLIHVPLIQPVTNRNALHSNLRFPIAILSFLSPINPYPHNLRHSLAHLLPHLASTYALALQYTVLQERVQGNMGVRHGGTFGLGGTFSDEGSELDLVAELSEQFARQHGILQQTVLSPDDRTAVSKGSQSSSATGTPFWEHVGLSSATLQTPGRSATETVDGYFSAKKHKSQSANPVTPAAQTLPEGRSEKTKRSSQKAQLGSKSSTKVSISSLRKREASPTPTMLRRASAKTDSDNGEDARGDSTDRPAEGGRQRSSSEALRPRDNSEKSLPDLISHTMLNSLPLQLFLAKPRSGDLIWTNSKFDAFRNQDQGRVRDPWANVHASDRNSVTKRWAQALKSGSQFTHYLRVKRFNSDFDYRWFIFRASTLLVADGRLAYWIGSFMDVHDQYTKSLAATEKEATIARDAKLRALADSIPQILFEAVEQEGIQSVNKQWQTFSGQSIDEARGLGFAKHVHRDDLKKCGMLSPSDVPNPAQVLSPNASQTSSSASSQQTVHPSRLPPLQGSALHTPDATSLDQLIQQGVITVEKDEDGRIFYATEIRLKSKGGEFRWFLVRLVKVQSDLINDGKPSWYGTCTDIDVRKALERELNQANKKVHQEMESKTKFFANMSHEIRTPLNGILGNMPWLMESNLDHDQRRTVDTIQNSSNNLRELVDNILDVTKVEAGKMTLAHKWFHIRTLLEEIIDTVSSRSVERGLELNYTVDADVPPTIKGDPFRVRQVLLNLMSNAIKFTEQGEVYTRCSLSREPVQGGSSPHMIMLAFDVVDTGRGFTQVDFQRLFKQFGQVDGASTHDAGSGLGLFLSRQLVEMHGGHLSAQSEAGEGSTFSFNIRVEVPNAAVEVTPIPTARPSKQRSSSSIIGSPGLRPDLRTPLTAVKRGSVQSMSGPMMVASPEIQSPALASTGSSDPSLQSMPATFVGHSSPSSLIATPDSTTPPQPVTSKGERQMLAERAMAAATSSFPRSHSEHEGGTMSVDLAHPTMYSVMIICPATHARAAIKQHIEQVVPHQIAVHVTTLPDIGAFEALMEGPTATTFTHVVLNTPASSDIMLFMRHMARYTAAIIPALIVITDYYQKRDIHDDFSLLVGRGRVAYLVQRPVKPALFAQIFDPAQLRQLSQNSTRSVAQSSSETFQSVADGVRRAIGNRQFRVLLVEDSDVNRQVIVRYLKKVEVACETATNGLECTEQVLGHGPGYYSLIICDIQMPKKNGYEACAEIRRWEAQGGPRSTPVPIMALTANAMPEERAAAAEAGFTDYLTKPVDFNRLGRMMMGLLDARVPHVFLRDRPAESQ